MDLNANTSFMEPAPSGLDQTVEFAVDAAIELEVPEEENLENQPISKKDAAIKSLVNFGDLKKGKSVEENKKEEAKPIYIKNENSQVTSTFVPSVTLPQAE